MGKPKHTDVETHISKYSPEFSLTIFTQQKLDFFLRGAEHVTCPSYVSCVCGKAMYKAQDCDPGDLGSFLSSDLLGYLGQMTSSLYFSFPTHKMGIMILSPSLSTLRLMNERHNMSEVLCFVIAVWLLKAVKNWVPGNWVAYNRSKKCRPVFSRRHCCPVNWKSEVWLQIMVQTLACCASVRESDYFLALPTRRIFNIFLTRNGFGRLNMQNIEWISTSNFLNSFCQSLIHMRKILRKINQVPDILAGKT